MNSQLSAKIIAINHVRRWIKFVLLFVFQLKNHSAFANQDTYAVHSVMANVLPRKFVLGYPSQTIPSHVRHFNQ